MQLTINYIYIYIYICIHTRVYVCVYIYIYIYICVCLYTYVCMYVYMCIYIYIYIYYLLLCTTCIYIILCWRTSEVQVVATIVKPIRPISLLTLHPTNIAWLKLYGIFPMDMRTPLLIIKIMLESNPLKSTMLVGSLSVHEVFRLGADGAALEILWSNTTSSNTTSLNSRLYTLYLVCLVLRLLCVCCFVI